MLKCYTLGKFRQEAGKKKLAKKLYKKACDGDDMNACNALGVFEHEAGKIKKALYYLSIKL